VRSTPCTLVLALALALAGCAGRAQGEETGGSAAVATPTEVTTPVQADSRVQPCRLGSEQRLRSPRLAYAGVVRSAARAYRRPGRGLIASFGHENANGHVTVFGVLAGVRDASCATRWYRVQLPRKPNGSTGYVRATDVELVRVRTRIRIDLSAKRLTLWRDGRKLIETSAAIGSPATPTPVGRFYVDQRLLSGDPGGPFGPGAVGISAFSEVLTDWPQGGPVAIHGTNAPETIGRAASHGCLRVRNDVLRRLFGEVSPGTPVIIHP
jgi:lipoprotein-anchoring transpeptidase ErfK/SrfK